MGEILPELTLKEKRREMVLEPPSGRRGVIQAGGEASGDDVWRRRLQRGAFRVGGSWVEGIMRKLPPPPRLNPLRKVSSGSTADPVVVPLLLVLPVAHGGTAPGMER